jgi:hypothetical protein
MRAIATLLLVFGAVAVTFLIHWSKRAAVAVADAKAIHRATGSLRQTAKQLYAEQSLPDQFRLSHHQQEFLMANDQDFRAIYGVAMDQHAVALWKKWVEDTRHLKPSPAEGETAMKKIIFMTTTQHGKLYCENRGIAD